MARHEKFHVVLIKPTHYDDDGYPIQWRRSTIPSNSLACVYGIACDADGRQVLGSHVDFTFLVIDETNTPVRPKKIIRQINADSGKGLVCFVGVQSNQFPRAVDLARPFVEAGVPTAIGGFHVSGCLSMLDETPAEIVAAREMGISIFAGEAEQGRFDEVLKDACAGQLKPVYNYIDDMPDLRNQPIPFLPREQVRRTYGDFASFDLGRGCPYLCSFCTIINVQGRVSRFRTADNLETIIRANAEIGIFSFFLTDDNLARNHNWEAFFDRMIKLREEEGIKLRLEIQVDTQCHRIKGFIDKAVAAGVFQVFIGMENINPDNLAAARKKQNKVSEYHKMFLAWKKHPVIITVGYILGFPNDTKASILHDIETIKRELPVDLIYFTNLTPLPGSEDHKTLLASNSWMDSDLNKYDLNHRVTHHEKMSDEDWDEAYRQAWKRYYTREHMVRILKRMTALGSNRKLATVHRLMWYRDFQRFHGVHPLEGGYFRRKYRHDRRPTLPRENPFVFYPKYAAELVRSLTGMGVTYVWLRWQLYKIWNHPQRLEYVDVAITPKASEDFSSLEISVSVGTKRTLENNTRQAGMITANTDRDTSIEATN